MIISCTILFINKNSHTQHLYYINLFLAVVWGDGVYFAQNATLSHHYSKPAADGTRTMYLCRVLTGDYCKGAGGLKVPPVKDSTTNRRYDSVVNDEKCPHLFVVFFDALAYPDYLITYN